MSFLTNVVKVLEALGIKNKSFNDKRYVNTTGDTMTGGLTIKPATNTLTALVVNDKDANRVLTVDTVNNRVGIGTTTPVSKLEVLGTGGTPSLSAENGIFNLNIGAGANMLEFGQMTASPYVNWIQSKKPSSDEARNLSINPLGGNVGIGTANPARKLSVEGSAYIGANREGYGQLFVQTSGNTNQDGFVLANAASTATARWWIDANNVQRIDNGHLAQLNIALNASGIGNVGIGTTNPTVKLEVVGTNTYAPLKISRKSNDKQIGISYYPAGTLSDSNKAWVMGLEENSNNFGFCTWNGSTVKEIIYFTNSNNVGIGTTNPLQKLDVSGKIALDGTTIAYRPTAFTGTLILGDGGTYLQTGADYNTFVGIGAGASNTTGQRNTANGSYSLYANTTGSNNTANGFYSLYSNTTGNYNSAQGYQALYSNTTGYYNSAQGVQALYYNTTGSYNSAIGYNSGRYYNGTTGELTSASNSLFLGASASALADGGTNEIVIGYNAIGNGSNTIKLGNTSITNVASNGDFETLDIGDGFILKSPDGTRYRITVADGGALSAVAV